ncbi:hypothetical protein GGI07_002637 [Coemansia sp. Benny D115]|nr:hypothetical protein GGI07_002637 [Coemansia sp. Benny D115]
MVDTAKYTTAPGFTSQSPSPDADKPGITITDDTALPLKYQFIDYRAAASPDSQMHVPPMVTEIIQGLSKPSLLPEDGKTLHRSLPTVLLYDNKGLELFDRITYLPEYYLTDCEIQVLQNNTSEIVAEIPDNSDVIELGCGSLRKTQLLLDALDQSRSGITYYAIDVMPSPLHDSLETLAEKYPNISFVALCGTYDEVLVHFKKTTRRKTLLWLGSSIGNSTIAGATSFISSISDNALTPNDAIIIGMDRKKDPDIIMEAYHDSQGLTDQFELNALSHVNNIISDYVASLRGCVSTEHTDDIFDVRKFIYTGDYDEKVGRHSAYLVATEDTVIRWPRELGSVVKDICGDVSNLAIKAGERIYIESSYKYGEEAPEALARGSGLTHSAEWSDERGFYTLNMFRKPRATMSPREKMTGLCNYAAMQTNNLLSTSSEALLTKQHQPPAIPLLKEWRHMWSIWDTLILHVIPREKLLERPIDLRHPFIFYLGHLPAFADIHMAAAESAPLTEPAIYAQWFERGIDPNVESRSVNHSHSAVPAEWPKVDEILEYRDRVRSRIVGWLEKHGLGGDCVPNANDARHVWMLFEHEAMHIETMLYMVLQMNPRDIRSPIDTTFAPHGGAQPSGKWIGYRGGSDIRLGMAGDNEGEQSTRNLGAGHVFGWDNEKPQVSVQVKPFNVRTHPVTNIEYLRFILTLEKADTERDISADNPRVPKSWIKLDSKGFGVRTVVGTPSITETEASLWPVFVSQNHAAEYAKWCGKRLPSEAEWTHASRTYHLANALDKSNSDSQHTLDDSKHPLFVDEYLDNLLATHGSLYSNDTSHWPPYDIFVPETANIDFAHWHPVPEQSATKPGYSSYGRTTLLPEARFIGSGWEWTSTPFYPFDGFEPSALYPGYSADFFDPPSTYGSDSTHYVVKGGSYATHWRIAQRQTFRNWYQKAYPYVLATFRLCEDGE